MSKTVIWSTAVFAALALSAPLAAQQTEGWDADGDGLVTGAEFLGGLTATGSFQTLDSSADGAMDATEWVAIEELMPFTQADLNADGTVDEGEYAGILFARYDADGSGALDATELSATNTDLAPGGLLGG